MFSEHAGYHGLRNTVTEFIGTIDRSKRIKLEDIKKYHNMRRKERGEKSITVSTARRRLAPRRKTSLVAKSNIGKCLISVAVPPRTGDSPNENTHFAIKFSNNLDKCLFSKAKFLNARDPDWDHHHVYMRPKITPDSSGLTWSSEDVNLISGDPSSCFLIFCSDLAFPTTKKHDLSMLKSNSLPSITWATRSLPHCHKSFQCHLGRAMA